MFLCLVDQPVAPTAEAASIYPKAVEIVTLKQLGINDLEDFTFRYDIMELNTAAKPFMLNFLMEQHKFDRVFYFDPDIEIFAPLTSVNRALDAGASMVLTPHICEPSEFGDAVRDITFLRAGVYNLGFFAATRCDETADILHWWCRRLRYDCINDQRDGLFVDQKFMDLVPSFAPNAFINRDITLNVAYWNIAQRQFGKTPSGWTVGGRPLTFFHFSGVDPADTSRLSRHGPVRAEAGTPLRALLDGYATRLLADGYENDRKLSSAFANFSSKIPIPRAIRQMYRSRYKLWVGNPFETYEEVLHLPDPDSTLAAHPYIVTNFMRFLYDELGACRPGLNLQTSNGVCELVNWYIEHAGVAFGLDWRLIAPVEQRIRRRALPAADVSVVGYLTAPTGVGQAGRTTYASLAARKDIRCDLIDIHLTDWKTGNGRIQIFHVNADQLPVVTAAIRKHLPQAAYRIAVPFWELEKLPDAWVNAFDGVDEIWASSRFIETMLRKRVKKPVVYMPPAFAAVEPIAGGRTAFGLPNDFLFFFAFDFHSYVERKNPFAAIASFKLAFPAGNGEAVGLVIKMQNSSSNPKSLAMLRAAILDDPRIHLIDATLSHKQVVSLITACDCVVSLHRSEGLGLLVAEAMLLERPVIATDYGATTELLTPDTGFPVDYTLVPVAEDAYLFGHGQVWAEPDIADAARLMRHVQSTPAACGPQVKAARLHLTTEYGPSKIRARQIRRLQEIGLNRPALEIV